MFITFSIFKQKTPNFPTLPNIYLETIWYDTSLSTELDVSMTIIFWYFGNHILMFPWQSYFDVSMAIIFWYFGNHILAIIFWHFSIILAFFYWFWSLLVVFLSINPIWRIQDGGYLVPASYDVIISYSISQKKQFWTLISMQSLVSIQCLVSKIKQCPGWSRFWTATKTDVFMWFVIIIEKWYLNWELWSES